MAALGIERLGCELAQIGMMNVRFVTVAERKFFGFETSEDFEWSVQMATVEKGLIDSFDRPELSAPVPIIADALRRAWEDSLLDPAKLVDLAVRFNSPTLDRRLGFFMDLWEIPETDELALRLGRKYAVPLDPRSSNTDLPVNRRWRVYEEPSLIATARELK